MLDDGMLLWVCAIEGVGGGEWGGFCGAVTSAPVIGKSLDDGGEGVQSVESEGCGFGESTEKVSNRGNMAKKAHCEGGGSAERAAYHAQCLVLCGVQSGR